MQKLSLTIFFSGLTAFLTSLGEFFIYHDSWTSMSGPKEVGHIILMTASFCMTVVGALGIQLPWDKKPQGDKNE